MLTLMADSTPHLRQIEDEGVCRPTERNRSVSSCKGSTLTWMAASTPHHRQIEDEGVCPTERNRSVSSVKTIDFPYLLKCDMVFLPVDDLPSCEQSNAAAGRRRCAG